MPGQTTLEAGAPAGGRISSYSEGGTANGSPPCTGPYSGQATSNTLWHSAGYGECRLRLARLNWSTIM